MAALNINESQFQELIHAGKTVLVDFWAPWCSYCRRIDPAYEALAKNYGDKIVVAKVNIDDEGPLSDREQVEVIPTLVLYRDGKALGSIVAPESRAMIEQFLRQHLPE